MDTPRQAMPLDDAPDPGSARDPLAHAHVRDDRFVAGDDARAMIDREHGASGDRTCEPHDPVRRREQRVAGRKVDAAVAAAVAGRGCHKVGDNDVVAVGRPRPHAGVGRSGLGHSARVSGECRLRMRSPHECSGDEQGADSAHDRGGQRGAVVGRCRTGRVGVVRHLPSLRPAAARRVPHRERCALIRAAGPGNDPIAGAVLPWEPAPPPGGDFACPHGAVARDLPPAVPGRPGRRDARTPGFDPAGSKDN
jgi:hypothetical protein